MLSELNDALALTVDSLQRHLPLDCRLLDNEAEVVVAMAVESQHHNVHLALVHNVVPVLAYDVDYSDVAAEVDVARVAHAYHVDLLLVHHIDARVRVHIDADDANALPMVTYDGRGRQLQQRQQHMTVAVVHGRVIVQDVNPTHWPDRY